VKHRLYFWILLMLMAPIAASSAMDLSALSDTTPTLESEIKRGIEAESSCSRVIVSRDYVQCIFAIEARNQQNVVDYKPFDTGLFFRAWIAMDLLGNPSTPPDDDLAKQVAAAGRHQAESMYTVFRADQRKVGVADEQLIEISGMSKGNLESRLAVWTSQPAP